MTTDVASVQFSRIAERLVRRPAMAVCGRDFSRGCATDDGRRSLKTQQHARRCLRPQPLRSSRRSSTTQDAPARFGRRARPDPASTPKRSGDREGLVGATAAGIGAPEGAP